MKLVVRSTFKHQTPGCKSLTTRGYSLGKEVLKLAKTNEGKKIVPVRPHVRKTDSGKVSVKRHRRSTPN
jgi:hypothetical protein